MKTEEQIKEAVKNSFSLAQVLFKLNLNPTGGNYRILKRRIKELNINITHFTGQAHLRGKKHNWTKKIPLEDILVKGSNYQSFKLKNRLLKEGVLKYECNVCKLGESWQGQKISHHLDHINGDNTDNRIENLRLICPNCHSQTHTYAGKNKARVVER